MFNIFYLKKSIFIAIAIVLTKWQLSHSQGLAMANTNNFSLDTKAIFNSSTEGEHHFAPTCVSNLSLDRRQMEFIEQLVFEEVNQYRTSLNLAPLKLNSHISEQAQIHSANMANESAPFSHEGFKMRIAAIKSQIPYRSAAENLGYNWGYDDPARQAVAGWIESPTHRKNMAGNYNLTGIGVAKNSRGEYYFTQIFILES